MSEHDDNTPIVIDFEQIEQVSEVFFAESKEILDELDQLILDFETHPHDINHLNNLFRRVHTLKGSVGAVPGGQLLGSLAHEFEALLSKLKKENAPATKECIDLFLHSSKLLKMLANSLRDQEEIPPEVLSEVIELITRYSQFEVSAGNGLSSEDAPAYGKNPAAKTRPLDKKEEGIWLTQEQLEELLKVSGEILVLKNNFQFMMQSQSMANLQMEFNQDLNKTSDHFQNQLAKILKLSAEECFRGLPALVRQASTELNKEVQFTQEGLEVLLDRNLGKDINEVLIHLVRNSLDHGIEDPFDRATQGKPSIGQLHFQVSEKSGYIVVDFKDDGKGLDKTRILQKALDKKLISPDQAAGLSDQDIFQFIFHPGFSTKEKITTISGRGMGMDVVDEMVRKYQGRITTHSTQNQGTHFHMEFALPQHLIMESTILYSWKGMQWAASLANVTQIQSTNELQFTELEGMRYCQWRQITVPVLNFDEIMKGRTESNLKGGSIVFLRHKEHILGLHVEQVIGQVDLMIKPFSRFMKAIDGVRGTSVLAGETVTYVIDPEKLIQCLTLPATIGEKEAA